ASPPPPPPPSPPHGCAAGRRSAPSGSPPPPRACPSPGPLPGPADQAPREAVAVLLDVPEAPQALAPRLVEVPPAARVAGHLGVRGDALAQRRQHVRTVDPHPGAHLE